MTHREIRSRFLEFFKERGHTIVPSSSLLPDDPSVLFTTAGMQQFKSYYIGQADPMKNFGSFNTVSIQKSMRTSDIDEVGDESHLTFFEMLGNFSFGGYFKKEAIQWAHEFISKEIGLEIDYVSVFSGEDGIPADEESEKIWKFIDPEVEVRKFGREDNFWGPTGGQGPCGPTTEIYVNGVEIWNIVFNEFFCDKEGKLSPLAKKGIDTGMGLERLAMAVQKKENIFETDLFKPLIDTLSKNLNTKVKRVIADHTRAIAFLSAAGVEPSNKDQGYILRRLIRRLASYKHIYYSYGFGDGTSEMLFAQIERIYGPYYPELDRTKPTLAGPASIRSIVSKEEEKFSKTLRQGLKELEKMDSIDAAIAFKLYESYGLPYEIIKELGGIKASRLIRDEFDAKFKEHQEKSRADQKKKFGGHGLLLDTGELKAANEEEVKIVTRLHTATHLTHAALRKILGNEVKQAGSDITAERLRFDFTFPRKLMLEEIKQIEDLVNGVIAQDLAVTKKEMPYQEAIKTGALSFFKLKYPPKVNVYSIGDFSKELCGGPHVSHTGEIGKFKISKEEAVAAGVRRIRAVVT